MRALVIFSTVVAVISVADARPKKRPPKNQTPVAAPVPEPSPTVTPLSTPADLQLHPSVPPPEETHCAPCHTVNGWGDVRFAHDKTGFPLKGAHRRVTCKACHPSSFDKPIVDRCAACHHEPHGGEFGQHCEGCHDEESWKTLFTADAHRSTNFPLSGRHAMIPCVECHPQARDRAFSRAVSGCVNCHLADYQRTGATTIDHHAANFSTDCRMCHGAFRFFPARFTDHDYCFRISVGPHAGFRCTSCHTSLAGAQVNKTCATNTAACTNCHTHNRAQTDSIHQARQVPGYQYKDRKCYECHRFSMAM
jgi:hypothetical protein